MYFVTHRRRVLENSFPLNIYFWKFQLDTNKKRSTKRKKVTCKGCKTKTKLRKNIKIWHWIYVDFKRIRISPDYVNQSKKNFFVMIRQLGPPTFFLTFSSVEQSWDPIVATLQYLHKLHQQRSNIHHHLNPMTSTMLN